MKTIIDYFKKRKEERLRAKIALNGHFGMNELEAVCEFIKSGSLSGKSGIGSTDKFGTEIDGGMMLSSDFKADEGGMSFIDGSLRDNTKNLEIKESGV